MLGLVKYCHNIEFTGVSVRNHIFGKQYEWARRACGDLLPVHSTSEKADLKVPGVNYHQTEAQSVEAACKTADIILMWCIHSMDHCISVTRDIPIVDFAQNSDKYAETVIKTNLSVADYHVACSKTALRAIPDKEKYVIYNGVDISRLTPVIGREQQRRTWGLDKKKILLFMGRFVSEKHPEMLLAALNKLPDDWVVVYVGGGDRDVELYRQAQNLFPDKVFYCEPQYHVGDILAAADVFMLPSDFEGHSLALCEAWFVGTPTVYTDFDTMQELESTFGPLGVKIPRCCSGDVSAKAVLTAYAARESGNELNPVILNARSVVWNHFTMSTIAHQWEEFLENAVFKWRRDRRVPRLNVTKQMVPIDEAK